MKNDRVQLLLVEDDPREAARVQAMIASWSFASFEVRRVGAVSDALAQLAAGGWDIVLLDLWLPDSQGLETFHRIHHSLPDIPVVVLADVHEEGIALQAVQSGAHDYLLKTHDSDETVMRAIQSTIERARAGWQSRQREEHARLLAEQLPCIVWTTDAKLRFTSFAGTALEALGIAPEETDARTVPEYFGAADKEIAVVEAHRLAASGQAKTCEMRWRGRVYDVRVEPFRHKNGRLLGTIGLALDVTEQTMIRLELRQTRRIQAGLIPSSAPRLEGLDIAGACYPLAEAGGDYFDYFPFGDAATGIAVCDVGGHGLGPALMMAHTRAYLRALALTHTDPGEILALVNRFLCEDIREERLVTLFLAKLEPNAHRLTFANAGHQGYHLESDGQAVSLKPTGIPLNVLDDAQAVTAGPIELASEDLVVLYTDGVVESLSGDGSQFGSRRLLDAVRQGANEPARQIVERLFREVRDFTAEGRVTDDMTAVVLKVL